MVALEPPPSPCTCNTPPAQPTYCRPESGRGATSETGTSVSVISAPVVFVPPSASSSRSAFPGSPPTIHVLIQSKPPTSVQVCPPSGATSAPESLSAPSKAPTSSASPGKFAAPAMSAGAAAVTVAAHHTLPSPRPPPAWWPQSRHQISPRIFLSCPRSLRSPTRRTRQPHPKSSPPPMVPARHIA